MSDKIRYPLLTALTVAKELVAMLEPACERIIIAGSIRREKPTVGDIELVYVPKTELRADPRSLFPDMEKMEVNLVDEVLNRLTAEKVIEPRKNTLGYLTWGDSNKLATHVPSGIPVDFFATSTGAWWNYLVCRTGGAETNKVIAMAANRKGWTWHPYGTGFTRGKDGSGEQRIVRSERDVFEFCGLPYIEPKDRQ